MLLIQNKTFQRLTKLLFLLLIISSCEEDVVENIVNNDEEGVGEGTGDGTDGGSNAFNYFVGIESGVDVQSYTLSGTDSLTASTVSPEGNGFEQLGWSTYHQGEDQIFVQTGLELISYELSEGELEEGSSIFIDEGDILLAIDVVDESTAVIVAAPWTGFAAKDIFVLDTDDMSVTASISSTFGDDDENTLYAYPTDAHVRGDKLFVSYYMVNQDELLVDDNARVSVFEYPSLEFVKEIVDSRAPNISRYYAFNGLLEDEDGDIYTFSTSSLACGYAPTPANNSGVLRINNGETEFDSDFHIDFETLSGGYKINDMYYVKDGKAVVRVLQEDETNEAYLWGTYSANSSTPLLATGILDLNNETFTLLSDVPLGGGGWASAYLVEDSKVYLGVSSATYSDIYVIDVDSETATLGAGIEGNYAMGILTL